MLFVFRYYAVGSQLRRVLGALSLSLSLPTGISDGSEGSSIVLVSRGEIECSLERIEDQCRVVSVLHCRKQEREHFDRLFFHAARRRILLKFLKVTATVTLVAFVFYEPVFQHVKFTKTWAKDER